MNKLNEHLAYHLFQMSILAVGFIAFIRLEDGLRIWTLLFALFSYVAVAIIHQYLNHSLQPKIMVEYLVMGGLCASILLFLLKGGLGF